MKEAKPPVSEKMHAAFLKSMGVVKGACGKLTRKVVLAESGFRLRGGGGGQHGA